MKLIVVLDENFHILLGLDLARDKRQGRVVLGANEAGLRGVGVLFNDFGLRSGGSIA
jgi:hypothetical protein